MFIIINASHASRHTSRVTRHTPKFRHTPHVTSHTRSHVKRHHTSRLTPHTSHSHLTPHITRARVVELHAHVPRGLRAVAHTAGQLSSVTAARRGKEHDNGDRPQPRDAATATPRWQNWGTAASKCSLNSTVLCLWLQWHHVNLHVKARLHVNARVRSRTASSYSRIRGFAVNSHERCP